MNTQRPSLLNTTWLGAALGFALLSGCGTVGLAALQARYATGTGTRAQAVGDPHSTIVSQVKAIVAKAAPGTTVTPKASNPWRESGTPQEDNANLIKFDLETTYSATGEEVEFYGLADKTSGKLVPGSLEILAASEGTFKTLNRQARLNTRR